MGPKIGITITQHILNQQRRHPEAKGAFSTIMNELIVAAKVISYEVNKAGLGDILGATGAINVQGESVQKLDIFANRVMIDRLQHLGELCCMASEEDPELIKIPTEYPKGNYIIVFDPLDGSTNIDVNINIGSIFGIYRRTCTGNDVQLDEVLQQGCKQVAAGYFIYGSSTIMVYTTGKGTGVHGFTLLPNAGEFLLSHPNIKIPERAVYVSINESYRPWWDDKVKALIDWFKFPDKSSGRPYSSRYIGSLVADFHRNLLKGGIFMYPADTKDAKKAHGKLRLMVEANPLAFIVQEAGGYASNGYGPILEIEPLDLHQRVPLFIGNKNDVQFAEDVISGRIALSDIKN